MSRHGINEAQKKRVARKSKESLELWSLTQITHVLSVADSSRHRLDFSAIFAHARLKMELLETEAVVIIACDGRLLILLDKQEHSVA
jgi:hypothetical protein